MQEWQRWFMQHSGNYADIGKVGKIKKEQTY